MASQRPPQVQEDPPAGAPAWMLTFCDCMTLLLTFFVLLLSFSSFDPAALSQLEGAMKTMAEASLFDSKTEIDDAIIELTRSVVDRTDKGAEVRTSELLKIVRNPKKLETVVETDAYAEERVLHIPIDQLFLGGSRVFTPDGRVCLDRIALFMRMLPCKVIIGAAGTGNWRADSPGVDEGMLKSLAVLEFFTKKRGFSPSLFYLSPIRPRPVSKSGNASVMQIVLLAKDIAS